MRGLYAITDDHWLAGRLVPAVTAVLAGGCRWVQYRSKQTDARQRQAEATALLAVCREYGAHLLVNDDVLLARTIGAHGVHLGQQDLSAQQAREQLGAEAIIGVTCHDSLALAQAAVEAGADYVAFGRFFSSTTKQTASAAPLSVLAAAKQQLSVPVVAIGGITLDNAADVIAAGADMLAVVGDIFNCDAITARSRAYAALFTGRNV